MAISKARLLAEIETLETLAGIGFTHRFRLSGIVAEDLGDPDQPDYGIVGIISEEDGQVTRTPNGSGHDH